jgi:hypothetical protein
MRVLGGVDGLIDYIHAGGQMASRQISPELESTYSWLTGRLLGRGQLDGITGVLLAEDSITRLQSSIADAATSISLPIELIKKHAGISPLSMQRLHDAVLEHGHPELLALVPPASDDAFGEYKIALDYVARYLGGSFEPDARRLSLARLIVHWMRGVPLGVIIENRAINRRRRGVEFNYPQLIRKVMEDVEDIARFEAPRYLSCYSDVVGAAAAQMGFDLTNQILDIEMMLELGVPRLTDMSFIAAGLSRATARAIVAYVPNPEMTPAECIQWLENADFESLDVPRFAIREMSRQREVLAARKWDPTDHTA